MSTDLTPEQYVAALPPEMRGRADCDPDILLLVALLDQYNIPPHRVTVAAVNELMRLVGELAADEPTHEKNNGMNTQPQCECDRCDRPLREFIQVDGWTNVPPGDCFIVPDSDGDALTGVTREWEPQRSGTTVRILIDADAEWVDVLRVVRKQLAWLERDGKWEPSNTF